MNLRKLCLVGFGVLTFATTLAGASEKLNADEIKRKTEICGSDSILKDTVGNFSKSPTPWFSGYAKILFDPHEAFLTRILLIQKAKVSIDISTYIFVSDETTNAILDELRKANQRGVNIRIMFDAGGSLSEYGIDHFSHLRTLELAQKKNQIAFEKGLSAIKPGRIDVVVFHPLLNMPTIISQLNDRFIKKMSLIEETSMNWNRRSHDKIFIIDKEFPSESFAIIGGRNMADRYYGLPKISPDTYEDIEVLMKNGVSKTGNPQETLGETIGAHYQNLFCSKGNYWIAPNIFDKGYHYQHQMDNALDKLVHKSHLEKLLAQMKGVSGFSFIEQGFTPVQLHSNNEIENLKHRTMAVMVDPNIEQDDSLQNGDSIFKELQKQVQLAKKSIDICTPYIFFTKNERDCLKKWVSEQPGRKLRLVSSSAATTDNLLTMATFDKTTAPDLMSSGTYNCHYHEIIDSKRVEHVASGYFDNRDHKVEVFEIGQLDNTLFKGEIINGKPALASGIYGKLHAKFGIVDKKFSFVGSDNLDPRSRHLNSETTVFIASEKIAGDLTRAFDSFVARSYRFDDPDLQTMRALKAVRQRVFEIMLFDKMFKALPLSESAI